MKKSLITLFALAGALFGVASAAEYSFTVPLNSECTNMNEAIYAGDFTFEFMIHDADDVASTGTLLAYYKGAAPTDNAHSQQSFVLTKQGDEVSGYTFSLLIGRSNGELTWADGTPITFAGLEEGVVYTVKNNTSYSTMYIGLHTQDGQIGSDGQPGTERLTYEGKINGGTQSILETGTLSTSFNQTFAVPEPATATLSLLALAGLAARRRRK